MLKIILKLVMRIYANYVRRLEQKIGYRLEFTNIPESWINGLVVFDITKAWKARGINAIGVDYFTLGRLVNGLSSRFIRTEKEYQSWLGAYLVKFKEDREFTLQDHFNLAVADQKNWLRDFGDTREFIEMSVDNEFELSDMELGHFKGKLYEFTGGPSDSDMGPKSDNWYSRLLMGEMAELLYI